ncbi:Lrp/AsnC family transcriptional regulator [Aurantiacibacter poecillastricola]|uniref:Lrp/AsnC family transcriptional regulator n=1 Tax=Aurantiacibacter poecillastricola TaxID=3064385 RepID=UPI00273E31D5|nr:Lrp/AsnC family transcriptional regulator [Aurantiacibacter sp. 219JJ12-13]MDP5262402.1 Lrp/AsnC family transcriptional regulator [Aurantiacibacter sp. 219JJ12-13]
MDIEKTKVDRTDLRILQALVENGRASDVTLGEQVNLSSTAVARRRKIMEDGGIISGYSAIIAQKELGYTITAMVLIELSSQEEQKLIEFEEAVLSCPSMSFCSFISGENDFMMLINVRSFEQYDLVYRAELSKLPYVSKIRSSFLLHEVARRRVAPAVLDPRSYR